MNTIVCQGLDGANPLHFLAALGALRLVARDDAEAALDWSDSSPFVARLHTHLSNAECHRSIARTLGVSGSAALRARQHRLQANGAKTDRRRIKRIEAAIASGLPRVLERKHRFATRADCIHLVERTDFRELARSEHDSIWSALLPGLAVDRKREYKKGESGLSRTRFSFSNGGSGKALLKDWRASIALLRRAMPLESGLLGFSLLEEETTGLMWDPAEQRDYARRWSDPASEDTCSVPIVNVLGFIGLSFLPVLPALPLDITAGFRERERRFVWPLWNAPLSIAGIVSVIGAGFIGDADDASCRARGIQARFCCAVVSANKRNFFAPARPYESSAGGDGLPDESLEND